MLGAKVAGPGSLVLTPSRERYGDFVPRYVPDFLQARKACDSVGQNFSELLLARHSSYNLSVDDRHLSFLSARFAAVGYRCFATRFFAL